MLRMKQRGMTELQIARQFGTKEERVRDVLAVAMGQPSPAKAERLEHERQDDERRAAAETRKRAMVSLRVQGMTLQEIADQFGMTRERVRQIIKSEGVAEARAARKLEAERRARQQAEDRARELDVRSAARHEARSAERRQIVIQSLQRAATYAHPLTGAAYDRLIEIGEIAGPSRQTVANVFGSWIEACDAAGIECGRSARVEYKRRWSKAEMLAYVRICQSEIGRVPTAHGYDAWAKTYDGAPSAGTVRNNFGLWSNVTREID